MEEFVRIIADSNITWSGAAIIIALILKPVLLAFIDLAKTRVENHADLERDRIDAEKDQTKMLGLLKDELVISRGINNQLISSVNAIPDAIVNFQTQAIARHDRADQKREAIHADLKTIPAEVWRLNEPQLDTLKTDFMRYIDKLQASIIAQIDPNALNAREAIRQEFIAITEKLAQIEKTLETLKPPTDPLGPKAPQSAPKKAP